MRHLKKIAKGGSILVLLLLQVVTPLALFTQHYNMKDSLKKEVRVHSTHAELVEGHPHNDHPKNPQGNPVNYNRTEIGSKIKRLLDAASKEDARKKIRLILNIRSSPPPYVTKIHEKWKKQVNALKQQSLNAKKFLGKYEDVTDTMRREVYNYLHSTTKASREKVKRQVEKLGGTILGEIITLNAIVAKIKVSNIELLSNYSLIRGIYADRTLKATLNVAGNTTNVPTWWKNGYNGSSSEGCEAGGEVAVLDSGINDSHPALREKVIANKSFWDNESTVDLTGHGTHVAGIIASTDETYRGISYGANLINGKVINEHGNGYTSLLIKAAEWAVTSPNDTADIISTSLGIPYTEVRPNGTSEITKFVDAFVDNYKVIWATAAGNDGDDGNETINPPGDAYNAITVGATNDDNTPDRRDDSIYFKSSRGPTADGRVKPDVVAPGTNIKSANANFRNEGNWTVLSGTSMATPMVSGAAGVMLPYIVKNYDFTQVNLPIKALLINSAQDMGEDRTAQGFGYIDLEKAWQEKQALYKANVSDGEREQFWINLEKGENFTASVVWNRRVKDYQNETSSFYPVSNLDLTFNLPNGSLLNGSNSVNNTVEKIHVEDVPKDGLYELVVKGTNVSQAVGTENFTLAASHKLLDASLKVNLQELQGMLSNKSITTQANITNLADRNITNLTAELSLPDGFNLTEDNPSLDKEVLASNDSWVLNWTIAPDKAGKFNYNLTVTSEEPDTRVSLSKPLVIWVNKSKIEVLPYTSTGNISESMSLKAKITNFANGTISDINASLSVPGDIKLNTSESPQTLPIVNFLPNSSQNVSWTVIPWQIGNITYSVTISSTALREEFQVNGTIVVRAAIGKLSVHPRRIEGTVGETHQISVNITNLANDTIRNVSISLSIPKSLSFSNRESRTEEKLPPQTTWLPGWEVKMETTGTFRYNITVASPDLISSIQTSGKVVIREKETFRLSPLVWILIGIGIIVGISVLVILVKRKDRGEIREKD